ncbi:MULTISPECIES: lipid-A-disaccharide synthase [Gammaproteobacteria]|uniref:lipid-A-disaccharide synthase n=1 Tax=Gammaproteobacteria TaxID=1236 RepID=UPI000DD07D24|nr:MULTISPECIES: lipid-A-disaccharide synthase [Gammaproteobacteria]RTE87006.1 lipid-A-disaccharide synthase [Aliidiomarina sp. B3213]TCZ93204.1 lipid-A-disaccharide synthase [Lysobacter sp. N42]
MSSVSPLKVGIVAGESSGDILGANLMKSLKAMQPDVEFIGVGGPLMEEQGLNSLFPMETLSVMGLVDVLKQLPGLLKARKQVVTAMLSQKPDVFVGIDAPDFNLPIETKLKAQGIKTAHYVSPSVWAWRPKRIFKVQKATHDVFAILPFEPDFYSRYNVPCTFVGHPLADDIPLQPDSQAARKKLGLAPDKTYVALLPGSRGGEAGLLTPDFFATAHKIYEAFPEVEFLLAYANDARKNQIAGLLSEQDKALPLHEFDGNSRDVMLAANSCILASGTVTLEAMLLKRPMVVCYKFGWLNYQILSRMLTLKYFSLPNLLADKSLVRELAQNDCTPDNIFHEVKRHLTEDMTPVLDQYTALHEKIRCGAGKQAAKRLLALIHETAPTV